MSNSSGNKVDKVEVNKVNEIPDGAINVADRSEEAKIKWGKVGTILYIEVVSPKKQTRQFSFHPSMTDPNLVLAAMQGRPWKERSQPVIGNTGDVIEGTRDLPARRIFDAMGSDAVAVVGIYDVTAVQKEKSLIIEASGAEKAALNPKIHV